MDGWIERLTHIDAFVIGQTGITAVRYGDSSTEQTAGVRKSRTTHRIRMGSHPQRFSTRDQLTQILFLSLLPSSSLHKIITKTI